MLWLPAGDHRLDDSSVHRWLKAAWHEIADSKSRAHADYGCKVTTLHSRRAGYRYLAKYVAKNPDDPHESYGGRRWGATRNLPTSARATIDLSETQHSQLLRIVYNWLRARGCRPIWCDWYTSCIAHQQIFADYDVQAQITAEIGIDLPCIIDTEETDYGGPPRS